MPIHSRELMRGRVATKHDVITETSRLAASNSPGESAAITE